MKTLLPYQPINVSLYRNDGTRAETRIVGLVGVISHQGTLYHLSDEIHSIRDAVYSDPDFRVVYSEATSFEVSGNLEWVKR